MAYERDERVRLDVGRDFSPLGAPVKEATAEVDPTPLSLESVLQNRLEHEGRDLQPKQAAPKMEGTTVEADVLEFADLLSKAASVVERNEQAEQELIAFIENAIDGVPEQEKVARATEVLQSLLSKVTGAGRAVAGGAQRAGQAVAGAAERVGLVAPAEVRALRSRQAVLREQIRTESLEALKHQVFHAPGVQVLSGKAEEVAGKGLAGAMSKNPYATLGVGLGVGGLGGVALARSK